MISRGLKFAFYLIDKNYNIPFEKLIEILEPYKRELSELVVIDFEKTYENYWKNPDECFDDFD